MGDKKNQAINVLSELGFVVEEDTALPNREVLSEFNDNESGACLAGARYREGFTQKTLSEICGIPRRHISEMENGRRPIGKKNARLLAEALHADYRIFL